MSTRFDSQENSVEVPRAVTPTPEADDAVAKGLGQARLGRQRPDHRARTEQQDDAPVDLDRLFPRQGGPATAASGSASLIHHTMTRANTTDSRETAQQLTNPVACSAGQPPWLNLVQLGRCGWLWSAHGLASTAAGRARSNLNSVNYVVLQPI